MYINCEVIRTYVNQFRSAQIMYWFTHGLFWGRPLLIRGYFLQDLRIRWRPEMQKKNMLSGKRGTSEIFEGTEEVWLLEKIMISGQNGTFEKFRGTQKFKKKQDIFHQIEKSGIPEIGDFHDIWEKWDIQKNRGNYLEVQYFQEILQTGHPKISATPPKIIKKQ